jgi:hypothetical protein
MRDTIQFPSHQMQLPVKQGNSGLPIEAAEISVSEEVIGICSPMSQGYMGPGTIAQSVAVVHGFPSTVMRRTTTLCPKD